MNSEVKEQNKPYRKMGRGRERSKVKSGNVIASGDPPIKTNSYSHRGHDSPIKREKPLWFVFLSILYLHNSGQRLKGKKIL